MCLRLLQAWMLITGNYTPSPVRDAGRGKMIRKSNQIKEERAKTGNKEKDFIFASGLHTFLLPHLCGGISKTVHQLKQLPAMLVCPFFQVNNALLRHISLEVWRIWGSYGSNSRNVVVKRFNTSQLQHCFCVAPPTRSSFFK